MTGREQKAGAPGLLQSEDEAASKNVHRASRAREDFGASEPAETILSVMTMLSVMNLIPIETPEKIVPQ
jgi:hypothetical protein